MKNKKKQKNQQDKKEVSRMIQEMKSHKSPGENGIPAELLKIGAEQLTKRIYQLILRIWQEEITPKGWNSAIICPIFKKGDKTEYENYRGIAIFDVVYKILAKIIRTKVD